LQHPSPTPSRSTRHSPLPAIFCTQCGSWDVVAEVEACKEANPMKAMVPSDGCSARLMWWRRRWMRRVDATLLADLMQISLFWVLASSYKWIQSICFFWLIEEMLSFLSTNVKID
jgi:hypothetical protein